MADNVVFQEAMDALRDGNKARARELLTGLIKDDQNNAEYWVWLSAAMETAKERVYCLQTALKLDPGHAAAKRGLILLGALPADETVPPFSMNRPRAWEENLLLAHEKPRLKGWAAVRASPVFRLGIVLVIIGAVAGGAAFGLNAISANRNTLPPTSTPGPSPTYTFTVTVVGGRPQAQATGTPGGIADLFEDVNYSPTPLYVPTERSPLTSDFLLRFDRAYKQGDWDGVIAALQGVIEAEPDAVFAYYYLGEAHRFKGDFGTALGYYNNALEKNADFGPAYVGIARVRLQIDPNANVLPILNDAIRLDPNFGEAYLERARVKVRDNDIQGAIADLGDAYELLPGSPLVFYHLAQARLKEGEFDLALDAARQAGEMDRTYLPTYLLLGQIHAALGNQDEAIENLSLYLQYEPDDPAARFTLGKLQFETGSYEASVQTMDRVLAADRNQREAYLYRFLANVELGRGEAANEDQDRVLAFYPDLFEANLGYVRAESLNGRNGNAFLGLNKTLALAETDEQKALAYYWAAIVYEERDDRNNAANNWEQLLELPEDSMTEAMRETARERLLDLRTPLPTPTSTRTRAPTVTPTSTRTPTPTRTATPAP